MNITKPLTQHYTKLEEYLLLVKALNRLTPEEILEAKRSLYRTDLFFLLWHGCNRTDMFNQWLLDRCKEVEKKPNGCLDLWARNHYKSTIITFGMTIKDILASHGKNPLPEWDREVTAIIFSVTKRVATGFLGQIKQELENNDNLKKTFPDILFKKPDTQSPMWNNDGIIVKRKSNPKEPTVKACGLVEGIPTGTHCLIRIYDDAVNEESVRSEDMSKKVRESWQRSDNLGTRGGLSRHIGTRYSLNDLYGHIIKEGLLEVRTYKAIEDGKPVFLSQEEIDEKKRNQGEYIFNCQMLQDPIGSSMQVFKEEWLRYYASWDQTNCTGNLYITVDPSSSKKKNNNDYTVMSVIALANDKNYYVVDFIRDRLSLSEKADKLIELHQLYNPINVGYEEYGMQADIEYIEKIMAQRNYHFHITKLGGKTKKEDRIRKLQPLFQGGCFYLPDRILREDYQGIKTDLVETFIKYEYLEFPRKQYHDDILDCFARILDPDMNTTFPNVPNYWEDGENNDYNDTYISSTGIRKAY